MTRAFVRPALTIQPGWSDEATNTGIRTIYDLLEESARLNPNHLFAIQLSSSLQPTDTLHITHSELLQAVDRCSALLVKRNIARRSCLTGDGKTVIRGEPVAIFLSSDVGIYIHLLALSKLGNPFALFSSRLSGEAADALCEKAKIAHVLTDQRTRTTLEQISTSKSRRVRGSAVEELYCINGHPVRGSQAEPLLSWFDQDWKSVSVPSKGDEVDPNDCSVAIFHSSGSTGLPKPIFHCHRYLLGYAAAHELPLETSVDLDVLLSTLPLYHGFGLLAPSLSLSTGMAVALPAATTIPTGASTVQMLALSAASRICIVPSVLGEMMDKDNCPSGLSRLQSMKLVVVGGAPMKVSLGERLYSSGVHLLNHFGVTEIGALAPICHPPPSCRYDWRYLLVRQDLQIQFQQLEGENAQKERTLRLGSRPFGWPDVFWVQDALEENTAGGDSRKQVRIRGRVDELLVLATGEKVSPIAVEAALREHDLIDEAVMFGTGRFQVGLIVETASRVPLERIWPAIDALNKAADGHAQVDPAMIILTERSRKPLARTLKGNPERQKNMALFASEMEDAYRTAEKVNAPMLDLDDAERLEMDVYEAVCVSMGFNKGFGRDEDFFELGMDSFKALKLLRLLQAGAGARTLPSTFIYRNASVKKLVDALRQAAREDVLAGIDPKSHAVVAVQRSAEGAFKSLQQWCLVSRPQEVSVDKVAVKRHGGNCIVITGSTGSLGSYLLRAALLQPKSQVSHIYCLLRGSNPEARQDEVLLGLGCPLTAEDRDRVTVWSCSLPHKHLGLDQKQYSELVVNATHIIHNAWPVDFLRPLESFEPQITGTARLMELGVHAADARTSSPTRLLFASSIAVVANYSRLHAESPSVPEELVPDARYTSGLGYAQAKLACEKLLEMASSPTLCAASSVRIGQLTGAEEKGRWSSSEHMASIIKSSLAMGALPDLQGSLSWIPVNRAGCALVEMVLSEEEWVQTTHLENPARQSWPEMIHTLQTLLGIQKLLPFDDWLSRVAEMGDVAGNPAAKIISFLQDDFLPLATGAVSLSTTEAQKRSETLRHSNGLSPALVEEYISYWRSSGFLPHQS